MKKLLIVAVSTALLASSLPATAQMGMLKKAKGLTSSSDAGIGDLTSQQERNCQPTGLRNDKYDLRASASCQSPWVKRSGRPT